jgi:hypothetical protein
MSRTLMNRPTSLYFSHRIKAQGSVVMLKLIEYAYSALMMGWRRRQRVVYDKYGLIHLAMLRRSDRVASRLCGRVSLQHCTSSSSGRSSRQAGMARSVLAGNAGWDGRTNLASNVVHHARADADQDAAAHSHGRRARRARFIPRLALLLARMSAQITS